MKPPCPGRSTATGAEPGSKPNPAAAEYWASGATATAPAGAAPGAKENFQFEASAAPKGSRPAAKKPAAKRVLQDVDMGDGQDEPEGRYGPENLPVAVGDDSDSSSGESSPRPDESRVRLTFVADALLLPCGVPSGPLSPPQEGIPAAEPHAGFSVLARRIRRRDGLVPDRPALHAIGRWLRPMAPNWKGFRIPGRC